MQLVKNGVEGFTLLFSLLFRASCLEQAQDDGTRFILIFLLIFIREDSLEFAVGI